MLPTYHPIYIHINKINKRLMLIIKDGYSLELQTLETRKLFGITKKLMAKQRMVKMCLVLQCLKWF